MFAPDTKAANEELFRASRDAYFLQRPFLAAMLRGPKVPPGVIKIYTQECSYYRMSQGQSIDGTLDIRDIRNSRFETFDNFLHHMMSELTDVVSKGLIEEMGQHASLGNRQASDATSSSGYDGLLELLDRSLMEFDIDGNEVIGSKVFVMHPSEFKRLLSGKRTKAHDQRYADIRSRKLRQWQRTVSPPVLKRRLHPDVGSTDK